jgi:hypothetical protein
MALLQGFVDPSLRVRDGLRKVAAAKVRARIAAVEVIQIEDLRAPMKLIAAKTGRTERNLYVSLGRRKRYWRFRHSTWPLLSGQIVSAWEDEFVAFFDQRVTIRDGSSKSLETV